MISIYPILSTSNKALYDSPRMFQLIVLLNIPGKFIEKVIGIRLQYQSITLNFVHLNQLDRLK